MNTNLNMQTMPIDRLKPAKYNPRKDLKPGDPAYEKIKRSLHDFGYVDPIVWNEVTGNIVGGHQRFKVLKAEGATEVDCVVVHIENPSDEKALSPRPWLTCCRICRAPDMISARQALTLPRWMIFSPRCMTRMCMTMTVRLIRKQSTYMYSPAISGRWAGTA